MAVSIVIPACNDADSIDKVVYDVRMTLDREDIAYEIVVVDDGSTDETARKVQRAGVRLIRNPTSKGYGHALLRGIDAAIHELVVIIDADGTNPLKVIPELVHQGAGYDMVIGCRSGPGHEGRLFRRLRRLAFRLLVEFTTGSSIPDINSGLRAFKRSLPLQHRHALSSGYSFMTTLTLISLLEGLHILYVQVPYYDRFGEAKASWYHGSLRSMQAIVEVVLLYNPLRFYLLLALMTGLAGAANAVLRALIETGSTWVAPLIDVVHAATVVLLLLGLGGIAFLVASGLRGRQQ